MSRPPRLVLIVLAALAALAVAVLIASCGGGDDDGGSDIDLSAVTPLPAASCEEVEYGGSDAPEALIASDLPLQGDSGERSAQQVEAIRLALERADWTAGDLQIGFQSCDDSIAETGLWDEQKCRDNATAAADNESVLGVIGTYNSGCAAIEIPIMGKADLALISPGNTAVCLTQASATCVDYDPASLYAGGKRNYARVVPNDAFQGAGLVDFALKQEVNKPFVLYADDDETSTGQAANFRGAAGTAGLELAGYETWDPEAKGYADLFAKVKKSGADAVVLAGLTEQNGGTLIQNKVTALGSNEEVPLIAFDGFAQQSTIDEAGDAAAGMFASVPGRAPENLSPAGAEFADELSGRIDGTLELYAPYAGEAAEVLLGAIATADDDRAAIIEAIFQTKRTDADILGSYEITDTGDPSIGPVTVFVADGAFVLDTEVTPPANLVEAARGQG